MKNIISPLLGIISFLFFVVLLFIINLQIIVQLKSFYAVFISILISPISLVISAYIMFKIDKKYFCGHTKLKQITTILPLSLLCSSFLPPWYNSILKNGVGIYKISISNEFNIIILSIALTLCMFIFIHKKIK